MGKQATEMLKGTLEGIVLAILAGGPPTATRSRPGCGRRASPTSPKAPSTRCSSGSSSAVSSTWRRSRPRRVRRARSTPSTLRGVPNSKSSGGPGASSQNVWNSSAKEATRHGRKVDRAGHGSLEQKKQYRQHQARIERSSASLRAAAKALERYLMYAGRGRQGRHPRCAMFGDFADLLERPRPRRHPGPRRSSATTRSSSPRRSSRTTPEGAWIDKERERLTEAIDRADGVTESMTATEVLGLRSTCRASRSPTGSCRCCAAWTSTSHGAASSPCSARTARARRRWCKILSTLLRADAGAATSQRLRCRHSGREGAGVLQPHRTVRGRRRDPHRAGEPGARCPAAPPQGPGHDRRRSLASLPTDRCGDAAGVDVLRGHAPPAGHRDEPDRQPPVIFLDEPTTGLDPQADSRCGGP